MAETTATICPNCQKPALRTGDEITCENCDAVFTITKKQEAKVKEFGLIQNHEERITQLEKFIPEGSAIQQQTEPEQSEEDEI